MSNWNTSNYRQRKAQRRAKVEPQWITNPETQEKFFVRRVGAVAYAVAGQMPHNLAADAVKGWAEKGVNVDSTEEPDSEARALREKEKEEEGKRNLQLMAKVVCEALVTPKVVAVPNSDEEISIEDLDDSDLMFIFKFATGQLGPVQLVGGEAVPMGSLQNFPKKPGRRSRTGTNG